MVEEPDREPEHGRSDEPAEGGPAEGGPSGSGDGPSGSGDGPSGSRRGRLAERYVTVRAATIARDGGPGRILRLAARAPAVTTVALAVVLGTIFAMTFGVPPVSPLFLVALLCAPVYPWLRLEARAIAVWRDEVADPGR